MKRYGNLWKDIVDIDNIKIAHKKARKDKSHYSAVKKTDEHLDARVELIQKILTDHTYVVGQYKTSIINDNGKERILFKLPYYPDRIIQWAIMLQIEPIFRSFFTDFTCASIPRRGIHYASALLTKYINTDIEGTKYCLKLDIKKFYPSINRDILKKLLRKKFKDKDLLIELDKIIDSVENSNIDKLNISEEQKYWYKRKGKGVPVGSYLSQYLANFSLSFFDHWLKEEKHCKYVIRYMDDIIILSNSKEFLHNLLKDIEEYLDKELDLQIKSNYQIFPVDARGIDFVGYRHFRGYRLLRKSTFKRCKSVMIEVRDCADFITEELWNSWVSSIGWIAWCDCEKFYRIYIKDSISKINAGYDYYKRGKNKKLSHLFMMFNDKFIKKKPKKYYLGSHNILHKKEAIIWNTSKMCAALS